MSEKLPSSPVVNLWLMMSILVAPAVIGPILAVSNNWLFSENGDMIMWIILALPVASGLVAGCLFFRGRQRIQRVKNLNVTAAAITAHAVLVGICCALCSTAFMFGACLCTFQVATL